MLYAGGMSLRTRLFLGVGSLVALLIGVQWWWARGLAAGLSKEVERRLRVVDDVIKYLTVRVDETRKRAEKLKAKRDKRNSRKPAPAEGRSAPSAPSAPQRPVPAAPPEGE